MARANKCTPFTHTHTQVTHAQAHACTLYTHPHTSGTCAHTCESHTQVADVNTCTSFTHTHTHTHKQHTCHTYISPHMYTPYNWHTCEAAHVSYMHITHMLTHVLLHTHTSIVSIHTYTSPLTCISPPQVAYVPTVHPHTHTHKHHMYSYMSPQASHVLIHAHPSHTHTYTSGTCAHHVYPPIPNSNSSQTNWKGRKTLASRARTRQPSWI